MIRKTFLWMPVCLLCSTLAVFGQTEPDFNVADFGTLTYWDADNKTIGVQVGYNEFNNRVGKDVRNIGLHWRIPRDIHRLEVVYHGSLGSALQAEVQYWQETWPQHPPQMPAIEDLEDNPWKGKWVTAKTTAEKNGNTVVYSFLDMDVAENGNADHLPGEVIYRRTLKMRLVYPSQLPAVSELKAFSMSAMVEKAVRIEMGVSKERTGTVDASLDVFNGSVKKIAGWNWGRGDRSTGESSFRVGFNRDTKGVVATIMATRELLPGSNDETVVTLRSSRGTFSFSMNDLEKEPIYVPHYDTYISLADLPEPFSPDVVVGKTILERVAEEPEQSYDRARNEIPHLSPWENQVSNRVYLPLATDGNWQKFAVLWGGDIFLQKEHTKAQGKELARCNWPGTTLSWQFGAGEEPDFERDRADCKMSFLNDYLPVLRSVWRKDGLIYDQEFVSTMLSGPLSPFDPSRDEQTPAVLLVKVKVSNPSPEARAANIWLQANAAVNGLSNDGGLLMDDIDGVPYIRCLVKGGDDATVVAVDGHDRLVRKELWLEANSSTEVYFYFPFVGDLKQESQRALAALDYETERARVSAYWRDIVSENQLYRVPERKFNEIARAVVPHIRMSATKDPKSGLFMVPAASLVYGVYANESCFQTFLLDRMGDFKTSSAYLNTFVELQGSRDLPGDFIGDQDAVYYGVRVDSVYDLTFNGYNMHHGITLWALARHFLHSRDVDWLKANAASMKRAADWVIEQRGYSKQTDRDGQPVLHYGLLPAGVLEDAEDWQHWFATNAYTCLALQTMARAFEEAGLPEASHYRDEAAAYYADVRRSVERSSELAPVVRLRNGVYVPYVTVQPYQRFRNFGTKKVAYYDRYNKGINPNMRLSATREVLYGPMVLIKTGIISADEPMAEWILNDWEDNITLSTSLNLNAHGWVDDEYWFSRGGMVFQANLQNPVPVYLRQHNIPAAIRGVYNNFVSCFYPDVNVLTEEYRMWVHANGPLYKIPDEARAVMVISEMLVLEGDDELQLAVGTPRRWLEPGQPIELIDAFTEHGQVSYVMQAGKEAGTVEADLDLSNVTCGSVKLFVRAPFNKPIKAVDIDGKVWEDWDAESECVHVPAGGDPLHIVVRY